MTSASEVSDLYKSSGAAFMKLAEISRLIDASKTKQNEISNTMSWTDEDSDNLQKAVLDFAHGINVISERIKEKTMNQIKASFKKQHFSITGNTEVELSKTNNVIINSNPVPEEQSVHAANLPTTINSMPITTGCKRSSSILADVSSAKNIKVTNTGMSRNTSSNITNSTPSTSNAVDYGTSFSSPFLHSHNKSANITLSMLNARDDSDDESRIKSSGF